MTATAQQLQNREAWRNALLSDKYQQGQDALRIYDPANDEHYHCCIGVALDVLGNGAWSDDEDGTYIDGDQDDPGATVHEGDMAGHTFVRLFGTMGLDTSTYDERDPDVREECVFINANDTLGKTFAQIADMIPKGDK